MKPYTHMNIRDVYAHKHSPEYARALADYYWRALLSVAFVITLVSLGVGISTLSAVVKERDNALLQNAVNTQPAPKLDKTQLQNTLDAFRKRESRFNSLKTASQRISDPSR